MKKILKNPLWLFTICMAVVLVFSLFANMVNTSMYQVSVKTVNFKTDNGDMEGLLYMPRGCSEDNKCPVIVTTHGYLNSKEMQDAPSIEMSRRGYIVLAIDMYDHGGSTWETPGEFEFFASSMWDAVKYVYDQPYTLKAANGDGMIAVSGHSMGGYSTELAVMYDEYAIQYGQTHRKIAVSLSVGADYRYSDDSIIEMFADRSSGMVIGHYDEFFGDPTDDNKSTVNYKDYVKTDQGKTFLGGGTNLNAGEEYSAGVIYSYEGGQRVIYTPNETHPWNHFSLETTSYMIEFYDAAFDYQLEQAGLAAEFTAKDKSGQTWWLKETFELIAMIGLFASIIPALCLLLKVPFFAKVKSKYSALAEHEIEDKEDIEIEENKINEEIILKENVEVGEENNRNEEHILKEKSLEKKDNTKSKRLGLVLVALITSLIPAYYLPDLITASASSTNPTDISMFATIAESIIYICIVLTIGVWLIYLAYKMFKKDENNESAKSIAWNVTKGSIIISFACLFLRYLAINANNLMPTDYYFNGPTANQIGFWAVISAAIALVTLTIVHFVARKSEGATIKSYGLAANIKQILIALLISIILFVGLYLVVFLIGLIFNTDFRFWVYAIKSFEWQHFVSFLRYVPIFFIYYFINSIVVAINTKDVKGWKGYLYALALNIGGLVLFLIYQYGKLFITGTAAYPTLNLESILVFGLIPSLAMAAVFAKNFYDKTNNVWTSAFFNTFLFTMITIANTAIYLLAK